MATQQAELSLQVLRVSFNAGTFPIICLPSDAITQKERMGWTDGLEKGDGRVQATLLCLGSVLGLGPFQVLIPGAQQRHPGDPVPFLSLRLSCWPGLIPPSARPWVTGLLSEA